MRQFLFTMRFTRADAFFISFIGFMSGRGVNLWAILGFFILWIFVQVLGELPCRTK